MRRPGGFTLIELMVVVAMVGILAALSFSLFNAASRNVSIGTATFELAARLDNLRRSAMSQGITYQVVVVDAPANNANRCNFLSAPDNCARYFVMTNPAPGWDIASFDPSTPWANGSAVDSFMMPRGVRFDLTSTISPPAPFNDVKLGDTDMLVTCAGNRKCFAVRYLTTGEVQPVLKGGATAVKSGFAFLLGSDVVASDRRLVVIGLPSGIVKTANY